MKRIVAAAFFSIVVDASAPPLWPDALERFRKRLADERDAPSVHPTLVYRGR